MEHTNQNPYKARVDADREATNRSRDCTVTLAIVLLNVAFSVYQIVRNLPDTLAAPDATAVVIGAILVFWIVWIAVELLAVLLIWRRRAAGRWILVASFGLKGIVRIGLAASWLPMLVRSPAITLASSLPYYLIQAICYCGATIWLIFFASLPSRLTQQGS